ncbi:MAG: efflux RND transporter periplasmic adaptor subunit [Gammaproteobacteria bacterium]|nr:efflux RND transporter periplasmic adaptor subunit [Gammaproteobacteria bacterium]
MQKRKLRTGGKNLAHMLFVNIVCSAGMVFAQGDMQSMPAARVQVETAVLRDMAPVVTVSGTVVSLNDSRISAEVEGVLTSLANVGDAVDAGVVIAQIDPRLMKIAVTRAAANVARLESEFDYRERQLVRTLELAQKNNASATLVDESRALRDQAMHQLADARSALEQAQGDLARATIRAAFSGHVVERLAAVGEYIDVGEDVIRLVDTHRAEISLPAPISLTRYVKPGMAVTVSSGDVTRQHAVRAVVPVGDAVSRMVEIRLDATDSGWLVGTPVQISLPSDVAVTTVAVPRDSLVERGSQVYVYKVDNEGSAVQVPANIVTIIGLWVGLADGIEAGDKVIVRGAERLAPGQPVEVIAGSTATASQ